MDPDSVSHTSSAEVKIALFRSLFRGRTDVYPRRFESRKTGKSGYASACANEWVRGICEKPRIKCAECPHRQFVPVTDDVIRWHLSGHGPDGQPFVAGVYALLQDDTCHFLAVDFDKADWRQDAAAYLETCRRLRLSAALERSRSGRGGHVWLFFEDAIPAALARRLGAHVLTETMEGRPDIGLDSYDRFFPNQDVLPQGGFGNLIALPLQKSPREKGNSVFLDDGLEPWPDQWSFLASVRRIGRVQIESIVQDAERRGRIIGVRLVAAWLIARRGVNTLVLVHRRQLLPGVFTRFDRADVVANDGIVPPSPTYQFASSLKHGSGLPAVRPIDHRRNLVGLFQYRHMAHVDSVVAVAPSVLAEACSMAGGSMRSFADTTTQDGFVFQAATVSFSSNIGP